MIIWRANQCGGSAANRSIVSIPLAGHGRWDPAPQLIGSAGRRRSWGSRARVASTVMNPTTEINSHLLADGAETQAPRK